MSKNQDSDTEVFFQSSLKPNWWCFLSAEQQQLVFETSKTIMVAIYNAIKHDNVYPVIMCGDTEAKKIISRAINSVAHILPST